MHYLKASFAAAAGWRRSYLPHTDVSLLQRATASFTVDGFLKALLFLMLYDTDILGAIPFSGSPVSLFKSSKERLGKKKPKYMTSVREEITAHEAGAGVTPQV